MHGRVRNGALEGSFFCIPGNVSVLRKHKPCKPNLKCDNVRVGPLEHHKVMRIKFYSESSTL